MSKKSRKKHSRMKLPEEKITIRRMVGNVSYLLKYAAKYDRPLIVKIMVLNILLLSGMAVNDTFILKMIINRLTGQYEFKEVIVLLLISLVLVVFLEWVRQLLNEWSKAKLIPLSGRIQRELAEKNSLKDLIFYDDPKNYDNYIVVSQRADALIEDTVMVVSTIIGGAVALFVASAMILTISPVLAIFPIAGFIVNLLTRFQIEKINYTWWQESRKKIRKADYSKRVFYQPEFAKECKLTDVREPLRKQFDEALDEAAEEGRIYGPPLTWISLVNWISVFTVFSFFAIPAYLGYLALVVKSIALGDVASANNAANYVRRNLNEINFCLVDFQQIGLYGDKLIKLLEYKPNIEVADGLVPEKGSGPLVLSHVSFRYPNTEKDTLSDISIEIHPGEKIAIVGENGAGKTTFVKLLMRLYDVTDGSISYGGHDIREYNTREYRKKISAVFQDYNIYAATIAENVLLRKVKEGDEEDVIHALRKADFGRKLDSLPEGINTPLTREFDDAGVNLSGGEGQKLAISRVFLRNDDRAVSILDEPSSALDPVSEYKLNKNLIENAGEDTVIFISHRLSTTRMADRIYLFEHGRIIEQGTHDELMERNGRYREMFDRQAQNYLV
ncbi:MAG: ABC transporter ATP-binding protein [Saccharofermentanaceae bacterium]|nr:ABC transporter ATP-binding protein [Clostridiales bacterium]MEE3351862.1 ABC transporter ATP-binding protein [Saccharofermentanaceae bacterium]